MFIKMKVLIILYMSTFSIAYTIPNNQCADLKLELVQVLFRHGARTPVQVELDACNYTPTSAYEPWGLGELNNQGKQQEYQFGKFLRYRYANYLRSIYKPDDLYAYSSDMSRTKMSLELVLAGLYPPVYPVRWNHHSNWSPIPYFSAPSALDVLLRAESNPKILKLSQGILRSDEYKSRIAKYKDFFNYVAENTNANNGSLSNTVMTFDVLISNEYMKLPLPDWYTPEVRQTFIEIMEIVWDAWSGTTEIKRSVSGPIIKTFIENMNLNGTTRSPRKIYLYSGHDTNIASFTRSHNIKEFSYPYFGSALIFEKLRDPEGQIYVRLYAWDGLGRLTALKFNDSQECSPIDDYLEIVKPVIPSEKEIDDRIGSLSSRQIRNLLFNSAPKDGTASFGDYFN